MVNYQQGKIYKIVNNVTDDIYIGSTSKKTLAQRMSLHRFCVNKHPNLKIYKCMNEIGVENFKIILLESFPCETKDELRAREDKWICDMKPTLNTIRACRSSKEYYVDNKEKFSDYYKTNSESIREKSKNYYNENWDSVKQRQNMYYNNHKEYYSNKRREYYNKNVGYFSKKSKEQYQKMKDKKQQEIEPELIFLNSDSEADSELN